MIRPQPKPVRAPKKPRKPMRRTRMVAKPPRRITRPGPGSDPAYLARVRGLPCVREPWKFFEADDRVGCRGDVVAHHAGPKTNDSTAIPVCVKHHAEWHDGNGFTEGWNKEARRGWAEQQIAETRRLLGWQP